MTIPRRKQRGIVDLQGNFCTTGFTTSIPKALQELTAASGRVLNPAANQHKDKEEVLYAKRNGFECPH
jgi:hypothetical protein